MFHSFRRPCVFPILCFFSQVLGPVCPHARIYTGAFVFRCSRIRVPVRMETYEDARLVRSFSHSARFDSLFFVHLRGVVCVQGPRNHAHVLASGSDDDFEFAFRARVEFDHDNRRMRVASATCVRFWMGLETVDPVDFTPIYEAISANFGIQMHASSGGGIEPALASRMDDVSADMEACWASLRRRHAAMIVQRAWRARRWRGAVRAVAGVVDRRMEMIKRRLWSPNGRLVANMFARSATTE